MPLTGFVFDDMPGCNVAKANKAMPQCELRGSDGILITILVGPGDCVCYAAVKKEYDRLLPDKLPA
jgi:hypothetical protein